MGYLQNIKENSILYGIRLLLFLTAGVTTGLASFLDRLEEDEGRDFSGALYLFGALMVSYFIVDKKYSKNIDSSKYLYFPISLLKISVLEFRFILISNKSILMPVIFFSFFFFRENLIPEERIYRYLLLFGQGVLFIAFLTLAYNILSRYSFEKHLFTAVYLIMAVVNYRTLTPLKKSVTAFDFLAVIDFSSNYSLLINSLDLEPLAGIGAILLTFPLFLSLILFLNTKFMLK